LQANSEVAEAFVDRSIFSAFKDYYRVAYTHNLWAYTLLRQFQHDTDELVPWQKLLLAGYDTFIGNLFANDADISDVSLTRNLRLDDDGYAYSLYLSHLYQYMQDRRIGNLKPMFPRGLPMTASDHPFLLEQATDWLANLVTVVPQPFLAYFHFFPPHGPYRTSLEFYNRFRADGYRPLSKPPDVFAESVPPPELGPRRSYDEFVLYLDSEFGRFYGGLEASGLLENTWVIFTSDHGELFERGIVGHGTPVLYQPLVRVPLLIFEPGREVGSEIHDLTSAVDLMPTLAQITGHAIPVWTEGVPLPPYGTASTDPNRSVYAVQARDNENNAAIAQAATMLVKGRYKLHYYFGYRTPKVDELAKLYDIQADPEELIDLSATEKDVTAKLLEELRSRLAQANKPFQM
jgi:hypothetical protein